MFDRRKRDLRRWPWVFIGLCISMASAMAQSVDSAAQQLLRQQDRERALREHQETTPDVHLSQAVQAAPNRLPASEAPCFPIRSIRLDGDAASTFRWALKAADRPDDPATGRCLGTSGINVVMKRVQNAIVARGYVTTRVLVRNQDLHSGVLNLTVVPGRP